MMNKKYIILAAAFTLGLLSYIIIPSPGSSADPDVKQGNKIEEEVKITYEDIQLISESRKEEDPEKEDNVETYVYMEKDVEIPVTDEICEMIRIVYLENGITYPECTYETVYLTACVILNRMYDWSECSSIIDVIFEEGQYSTAYQYSDYNGSELGSSNPTGWAISIKAVNDALENCDRNPHYQSRSQQGEVYYMDPNTGEVFCY